MCEAGPGRGAGYATRFAGKEAVFKVLGATEVTYTEVEIAGGFTGPADVRLHGRAAAHAARAGIGAIVLWLGYGSDYAMAVAIGYTAAGGDERREG